MGFDLNIYAKSQDDALQIVEQVLPYFAPQYTLSMKPFSDIATLTEDVPITLTGVAFNDDFEGAIEQRRTIVYTLSFEMKISFYGRKVKGMLSVMSVTICLFRTAVLRIVMYIYKH